MMFATGLLIGTFVGVVGYMFWQEYEIRSQKEIDWEDGE